MADQVGHQQRQLTGQGINPDQRPLTEWRNRPIRFIPNDVQGTLEMSGTAEHVIVDTQIGQVPGIVQLPPISAIDTGIRFTIHNLDKSGAPVFPVTVVAAPGELINEQEDAEIVILGANECRQFVAQVYEFSSQLGGPRYRSWYCCLAVNFIPPPP